MLTQLTGKSWHQTVNVDIRGSSACRSIRGTNNTPVYPDGLSSLQPRRGRGRARPGHLAKTSHPYANLGTEVTSAVLITPPYLCRRPAPLHQSVPPLCHLFGKFTPNSINPTHPTAPSPLSSDRLKFKFWKWYMHNEYNCVIADIIALATLFFVTVRSVKRSCVDWGDLARAAL